MSGACWSWKTLEVFLSNPSLSKQAWRRAVTCLTLAAESHPGFFSIAAVALPPVLRLLWSVLFMCVLSTLFWYLACVSQGFEHITETLKIPPCDFVSFILSVGSVCSNYPVYASVKNTFLPQFPKSVFTQSIRIARVQIYFGEVNNHDCWLLEVYRLH